MVLVAAVGRPNHHHHPKRKSKRKIEDCSGFRRRRRRTVVGDNLNLTHFLFTKDDTVIENRTRIVLQKKVYYMGIVNEVMSLEVSATKMVSRSPLDVDVDVAAVTQLIFLWC